MSEDGARCPECSSEGICQDCYGEGTIDGEDCDVCDGEGECGFCQGTGNDPVEAM